MSALRWTLIVVGASLLLYAAMVGILFLVGRRSTARDLATFIPDCLVLVRGLLRDARVSRGRKLLLGLLLLYLAMPFDIVPDMIPMVGALDDLLLIALVLRSLIRGTGRAVIDDNWRGRPASLAVVLRAAGVQASKTGPPEGATRRCQGP